MTDKITAWAVRYEYGHPLSTKMRESFKFFGDIGSAMGWIEGGHSPSEVINVSDPIPLVEKALLDEARENWMIWKQIAIAHGADGDIDNIPWEQEASDEV
jgi:hypothetical protein